MKKLINNFNTIINTNLLSVAIEKYKNISDLNKKTFWIIFLGLNFVFLFHTINFFWGNHDWHAVKEGMNWDYFFFNGRYSATAIKMLLTKGQVLPIINNMLAFLGFSLGAVAIMEYWKCPKELSSRVFVGLILTCTPFVNVWLWFAFHSIENLTAPLFVALGLILSLKSNTDNKFKNIAINLLAIFCLVFALGVYPSLIVAILTLFMGRIFVETLEWDIDSESFNDRFLKFKNSIINILSSMVIYKIILFIMHKKGFLENVVNIQSAPINEIIKNIIPGIKASFVQLFSYKFICMPQYITSYFLVLTLLLCVLGIYKLFKQNKPLKLKLINAFIVAIVFIALLFVTKTAGVLALKPVFYSPRIDFYGLMLFRGLIVLLLLKYGNNFIKNITYIFCILILWVSLINNLVCLKSFKLGFDSEMMRTNRLIQILDSKKEYKVNELYDVIAVGYPEPMRPKYIQSKFKPRKHHEVSLGSHTLSPEWSPFYVLEFVIPEQIIKDSRMYLEVLKDGNLSYKLINQLNNEDVKKLSKVINELEPFPSQNCIKIVDDRIFVVFQQFSLDSLKNNFPKIQSEMNEGGGINSINNLNGEK